MSLKKNIIASWQVLNIPLMRLIAWIMVARVENNTKLHIGRNTNTVIACNHLFWTDPFLVGYSLSVKSMISSVPFSFFIANKYINNLLLRPFAILFGGFPAKEHPNYGWGMEEARRRLKTGPVMIFPEGRFTTFKGQHEPKWGVSALAKENNTLILPVRIKRRHKKLFKSFEITYGNPENMAGKTPQEIMDIIYSL